jgi:protein disulfide-isomerase A1
MIPYMDRRYETPVMSLSKGELHNFEEHHRIAVIGFWESGDEMSNSTFTRVAEEHIDYYAFAATTDETAALAAGVERPGIALYKHYDKKQTIYQGKFEEDDIADFINLGSIPLVGEYSQKWAWTYFGEVRKACLGSVDDASQLVIDTEPQIGHSPVRWSIRE